MSTASFAIFSDPYFSDFRRARNKSFDKPVGRSAGDCDDVLRYLGQSVHPFDVVEHKEMFELIADAPGITPEELKIELDEDKLTVSGSHKEVKYIEEADAAIAASRASCTGGNGGGSIRASATAATATAPAARQGTRVLRSERRSYQFSRMFVLPENIDVEKITAGLDKGVLTISIPKLPAAPKPEPKRIAVTMVSSQ